MVERDYQLLQDNHPARPALYIEVRNPDKTIPFLKDARAPIDTGAPYIALPLVYKKGSGLKAYDSIPLKHGNHFEPKCPLYLATVTAEECIPQMVEVVFLETVTQPIIGRSLMKYWNTTLNGPEQKLIITEP